jgi:hypothetical protein
VSPSAGGGSAPPTVASSGAGPRVKTTPQVTKPVNPPTSGNVKQTVAPRTVQTKPPVDLSATAEFGTGLSAKVLGNQKITFSAHLPGELSGPAAKVTVQFTNNSRTAVSLANVVINDADAAGTPMSSVTSAPAAPVSGSLAPGQHATGVYVFSLPPGFRNPCQLSMSYSTAAPVVLFVGNVK